MARTLKTKLISALLKCFFGGKWKSKSPTNSRDFYPDHICIFFFKTIFFLFLFETFLKPHQFILCLYYLYNHQIWRELWRQNWYLLLLKCFLGESGSQKVRLTAGISTLTPPNNDLSLCPVYWPLGSGYRSCTAFTENHKCWISLTNINFNRKLT